MIARHAELCEFLLGCIDTVPFLRENLRKKDMINALDEEALRSFFDFDLTLGLFVRGGTYERDASLRGQVEDVELTVVIGGRNLSSDAAALGAGAEPGCWDVLEAVRALFSSDGWKNQRGNIRDIEPIRWRMLHAVSGQAVLGLELRIELARPLTITNNFEMYGTGYTEQPENWRAA